MLKPPNSTRAGLQKFVKKTRKTHPFSSTIRWPDSAENILFRTSSHDVVEPLPL